MPAAFINSGLPQPQGLGEDPLYFFTRVYIVFLQGLFKQFPEGSYQWSEDEKKSEISITGQVPVPKDRVEQRPALVVMRGPAQWGNISLDNLQSVDATTGKRRHTDLVSCTMSISAIAKVGPETQRLAWIVFTNIRRFNRLLQRAGGMHLVGNQLSIGNESPPGAFVNPEPDPEMTMITVQSPFFFKWSEEITPIDAPRAHVEAYLTAQLAPPDTTGIRQNTVLRQPTVRGVPVGGISIPIDKSTLKQTVKP